MPPSSADPIYCSVSLFVFLQFALEKLTELEHWKQELEGEAHTLIDFFCEDKETMKLDECFQIFRDFCVRFNKAVKVRPAGGGAHFQRSLISYFSSCRPGPLPMVERPFISPWFQEHLARWRGQAPLGWLGRGSAFPGLQGPYHQDSGHTNTHSKSILSANFVMEVTFTLLPEILNVLLSPSPEDSFHSQGHFCCSGMIGRCLLSLRRPVKPTVTPRSLGSCCCPELRGHTWCPSTTHSSNLQLKLEARKCSGLLGFGCLTTEPFYFLF